MEFQWYPGHMTKAKRAMQEDLKLIDVIVELVDARVPMSSKNPDIDPMANGKSRIILLNKSDLADPKATEKWVSFYEERGFFVAKVNAKKGTGIRDVNDMIVRACQAKIGDIVSYIPQVVYMNGETICNNVALLAKQTEIDDERIIECLKYAQIWEDIAKMPEGIHTVIGENGTAISGGQRQRIALARALYKNFELLIMDEATAALDMETEKAVMDAIGQVRKERTLLIVTHHMSLANECDIVYKIQDRKLVRVR